MKRRLFISSLIIIIALCFYISFNFIFTDNIKNKNVILMGDSLSLEGRWTTSFINLCECDGEIYGNGSAGFVMEGITKPYEGLNVVDMLEEIIANKLKKEKEIIDYIIVGAGINDTLDKVKISDVEKNVKKFITLAQANFPNAKLVIIPIHTFPTLNKDSYQKYETIIDTAKKYGIETTKEFIWWTIDDQSIDVGDNVHLTDEGYTILGKKILDFVNGKKNNLDYVSLEKRIK